MEKLIVLCLLLFPGLRKPVDQDLFAGTIKYELNYHIPEQGRRAMEKSGFAVTNGMEISGDGSGLNIKILSSKGVKMEVLYTKNFSCYVDRPNRKAYKMEDKSLPVVEGVPKISKTEEFETILGHKCRKYIIEHDGGAKQFIWACADLKVSYGLYEHIFGNGLADEVYAKEIEGVPLKITSGTDSHGFEMNAVTIEDKKPETAEFSLPSDFKILPYNQAAVGKMLMGEQQ